jgi:hypothetical protein
LDHVAVLVGVDERPLDGHGRWHVVEVEVPAGQPQALTTPQAGERGQQHGGPQARCDELGQALHVA